MASSTRPPPAHVTAALLSVQEDDDSSQSLLLLYGGAHDGAPAEVEARLSCDAAMGSRSSTPTTQQTHMSADPLESPKEGLSDDEHELCGHELTKEELLCPICHDLLVKPVVNACGHSACFWCTHRAMDPLSRSSCPLCRADLEYFAAPCAPLYQYVATRFFDEVRELEAEAAQQEATQFHARSVEVPIRPDAEADLSCVVCRRPHAARGVVSVCGHIFCEGCFPSEPRSASCPCGARLVYRPKPCQLLLRINGETDESRDRSHAEARSGSWLEAESDSSRERPYTHFGVGCDGCGAYPVVGRAFRCRECPEEVGFDLCESCHSDASLDGVVTYSGRFGQSHRRGHVMEERRQVRTWLHELQAKHPEMSIHDVLGMAQLQQPEP